MDGYKHQKAIFRYLAYANLRDLHLRSLLSDKVTVCCTLSKLGMIGPYIHFFKWKRAGRHFGALWDKYWRISYHAARTERLWQDEKHVISRVLGNCTYRLNIIHAGCMHVPRIIISFHVIWFTFLLAPRWPYLTVCELFLWGFLRKRVYANKPGRESWRY